MCRINPEIFERRSKVLHSYQDLCVHHPSLPPDSHPFQVMIMMAVLCVINRWGGIVINDVSGRCRRVLESKTVSEDFSLAVGEVGERRIKMKQP